MVEPDTNFLDFHHIIQISMGRGNYHLYKFEIGDLTIAKPNEFMEIESIEPAPITINEVLKKTGEK